MPPCGRCGDIVNTGESDIAQEVLRFMMTFGLCPKDLVTLTDPDIQDAFNLLDDDAKIMIEELADTMRSGAQQGVKMINIPKGKIAKPKKKKSKKPGK